MSQRFQTERFQTFLEFSYHNHVYVLKIYTFLLTLCPESYVVQFSNNSMLYICHKF